MGRIKERRMGLRRRWLWNTAAVVASVGLVCALAVTVLFALTDYSNLSTPTCACGRRRRRKP